jgi:hypothetical protein
VAFKKNVSKDRREQALNAVGANIRRHARRVSGGQLNVAAALAAVK